MKYYICLNLTPEQVRELKQVALDENLTIKKVVKLALEKLGIISWREGSSGN